MSLYIQCTKDCHDNTTKVGAEPLCKTAEELLPLVAAEEEEDSDDGDDDDEDQLEKSLGGEDEENFKPLDLNVSTDRLGE